MKKMGKEEKGFTLIELLAVIVILAIIAVIAIPLIGGILSKSKDDADLNTASQIYNAARMYVVGEKNGDFTTASTIKLIDLQPSSAVAAKDGVTGSSAKSGYIDSTIYLPSTKLALDPQTTKVVFKPDGNLESVVLHTVGTAGTEKSFTAEQVLSAKK